jgi:hypothetical protein
MAALSAAIALTIGATGALTAGPAFAYPPQQHMTAAATLLSSHRHQQRIQVQINNAKPGCTIRIAGGGDQTTVVAGTDTAATGYLNARVDHAKRIKITAKTVHCKRSNERATTEVTLSPGEVRCGDRGKHGRPFQVDLDNWRPHRRVVVIVTNGRDRYNHSGWSDGHGHVSVRFTPGKKGVWAVIVVQDGRSASAHISID